jgi:hypothetical protein
MSTQKEAAQSWQGRHGERSTDNHQYIPSPVARRSRPSAKQIAVSIMQCERARVRLILAERRLAELFDARWEE